MLGFRKVEMLYKLCKHLGSTLTCYSPQWWWHVCMFHFHIMPSSVENTFSLIFRTQFLPQPQHIWRCSIAVPTSFPSVSIWMAPLLLTTSFHASQAILLICIAHSIIQLLPSLPLLSHPPNQLPVITKEKAIHPLVIYPPKCRFDTNPIFPFLFTLKLTPRWHDLKI